MYKLDSHNGTGNKKAVNLDCLSHILARGYTKDLKEKLERQEYPNKTFAEAIEEKLNARF